MKNVYIYCEGQTEEAFVNEVLSPYFANLMIFVTPIVCTTKRTTNAKFRGGVRDYYKIKHELTILCKSHKNEFVTTMFDYYGMPSNTPMIDCDYPDLYNRIRSIEQAINADIGMENCFFNLMVHEFEGILFSSPPSFGLIADNKTVNQIQEIRNKVNSPEHINNSPQTAPSKRLEDLIPNYAKVKNGTILAKSMGMDIILKECQHFSGWIEKIRTL